MTEQKTRIRITHLILGLAVVSVIGSYGYGMWLTSQEEKQLIPRLALNSLIKVLLAHHKRAARFPETFTDVDQSNWQLRHAPVFGNEGRTLYFGNYYYLYYSDEPAVCRIWALPMGSRREEGSTYFLVLSPEGVRRWKGPALSDDEIKHISLSATEAQLASLGLIEQPTIYFKRQPQRRAGM